MSELAECYADYEALNDRYHAAHREIARLTKANAKLREALTMINNAPAPIERAHFPRCFNRLRVIAGDALANSSEGE